MLQKQDCAAAFVYLVTSPAILTTLNITGAYIGHPILQHMGLSNFISRKNAVATAGTSTAVGYAALTILSLMWALWEKGERATLSKDLLEHMKALFFSDFFGSFFLPLLAKFITNENYRSAIAAGVATFVGSVPIILFFAGLLLAYTCCYSKKTPKPAPAHTFVINVRPSTFAAANQTEEVSP